MTSLFRGHAAAQARGLGGPPSSRRVGRDHPRPPQPRFPPPQLLGVPPRLACGRIVLSLAFLSASFATIPGIDGMVGHGGAAHRATRTMSAGHVQAGASSTRRQWREFRAAIQWSGSSRTCWQKELLAPAPSPRCAPRSTCDLLQCLVLTFSRLVPPQITASSTTWRRRSCSDRLASSRGIAVLQKHDMKHRAMP